MKLFPDAVKRAITKALAFYGYAAPVSPCQPPAPPPPYPASKPGPAIIVTTTARTPRRPSPRTPQWRPICPRRHR